MPRKKEQDVDNTYRPTYVKSAESRGFGDDIPWIHLNEALVEVKKHQAPIMLIIHKSWCGSCKALKSVFSSSREIRYLTTKFIMVNTEDDDEPQEKQYRPDGTYIPRIFFINNDGLVMTQFYNDQGDPKYKYFYSDSPSIIRSMKRVLQAYELGGRYTIPRPPRVSSSEEFVPCCGKGKKR